MAVTDLEKRGWLLVELHVMFAVVPRVPVALQRRLQFTHMHKVLEPFLLRRKKRWNQARLELTSQSGIRVGWNLLNQSGIRWVGIYSQCQWVRIYSIKSIIRMGLRFTKSVIREVGIYSKCHQ